MTEEAKRCVDALKASCADQDNCDTCPCDGWCHSVFGNTLYDEAADLIESLSAELEQVKRERDAAVEALRDSAFCGDCEHYAKSMQEEPCNTCMKDPYCSKPNWQWRGVKEE